MICIVQINGEEERELETHRQRQVGEWGRQRDKQKQRQIDRDVRVTLFSKYCLLWLVRFSKEVVTMRLAGKQTNLVCILLRFFIIFRSFCLSTLS